jgi:hypothetical protein
MDIRRSDTYKEWGVGLVNWLASLVDDDGVLYDSIDGAPTPDDHYAVTHFALAAVKLAERTGEEINPKALLALGRYLNLPPEKLGHFEFNNQGLLEISLSPFYDALSHELKDKIERYLSDMRWQSGPGRNVSVNWLALRSACHGLNWRRTGRRAELKLARRFARYVVNKYRLDDGFFTDYSYRRRSAGYAVPLTYHAATCLGLALYYEATGDGWVLEPLTKALLALRPFVSSEGDGFVYGRTNACLISYCYALRPVTTVLDKGAVGSESEAELKRLLVRLLAGLSCLRNADGSFDLNRHPNQRERPAWDDYMHNTVYNSAAAAIFLASPPVEPGDISVRQDVTFAPNAGLVAVETGEVYAVFSARGAFVPGQAELFYGYRYAGCQPLFIRHKGEVVVPPPPGPGDLSLKGGVCGFVPTVEVDGELYVPWVYDDVSVYESNGATVVDGRTRLFRVGEIDWRGRSVFYKMAFKVYNRLIRDAYRSLSLRPLSGARLRRVLLFHRDAKALVAVTCLEGLPQGAKILSAGVRTGTSSRCFYKVVRPQMGREAVSTEVTTSYGPAVVLRAVLDTGGRLIIEVLGLSDDTIDVSYVNGGLIIIKNGEKYSVDVGLDSVTQ